MPIKFIKIRKGCIVKNPVKNLLKQYETAKWKMLKNEIRGYNIKYSETYYANDKRIFSMLWSNFACKPDFVIH